MTREEVVNSMSLQDAIQVLKDTNCYGTMDIAKTVILKALEQEPCDDAISREDALMALTGEYTDSPIELLPKAIKRINALPPVKPAEKVGQWIDIQYFKADDTYYRPKCPFCSIEPKEYSNYCPNCGRRMIQEVEE